MLGVARRAKPACADAGIAGRRSGPVLGLLGVTSFAELNKSIACGDATIAERVQRYPLLDMNPIAIENGCLRAPDHRMAHDEAGSGLRAVLAVASERIGGALAIISACKNTPPRGQNLMKCR